MKLTWEKSNMGIWYAFAGKLIIGIVVDRPDGTAAYDITGLIMSRAGKSRGDVSSISSGKRAIERGWRQWLRAAGLV
ncbi:MULTISPECIES: hypothetical protein [unclassified Agrobacterium]